MFKVQKFYKKSSQMMNKKTESNRVSYSMQKIKSLSKMQLNSRIQKRNVKIPFIKQEMQSSNKFKLRLKQVSNQKDKVKVENKQAKYSLVIKNEPKPFKKMNIYYNLKIQNEQKNTKISKKITFYSLQKTKNKGNQLSKPKINIDKAKKNLNLNCRFDLIQQYQKEKDKIISKDQQYQSLMCKRKTCSLPKLNNQKFQYNSRFRKSTIHQDGILEIQMQEEKLSCKKQFSQKSITENSVKRISKTAIELTPEIKNIASVNQLYLRSHEYAVSCLQMYLKGFYSYINFQKYFISSSQVLTEIMRLQRNINYYFKSIYFKIYQILILFQKNQIKFKFYDLKAKINPIIIKTLKIRNIIQNPNQIQKLLAKAKNKHPNLLTIQNLGGANNIYVYEIVFLQKTKYFRIKQREDGYAIPYFLNHQKRYQISGIKRKPDSIDKILIYLSNFGEEKLGKIQKIKILNFVHNNFFLPLNLYGNQMFQRENHKQFLEKSLKILPSSLKTKKILVNDILNAEYSNENIINKNLRKKLFQVNEFKQVKDYYAFDLVQILCRKLFYNGKFYNFTIKIIEIKKENELQYAFLIIQPLKIQYCKFLYITIPLKNKKCFSQELSIKVNKFQGNFSLRQKYGEIHNFQHTTNRIKNKLSNLIKDCATIQSIKQELTKKNIFSKQNWSQLILNQSLLQFPYIKIVKKVIWNKFYQYKNKTSLFVVLKIYILKEIKFILVLVQFQSKHFFALQQLSFLQSFKNYKYPLSKMKYTEKKSSQKAIKLKLKSNQKMTQKLIKQIQEPKQKQKGKSSTNQQKNNRFQQNQQNKVKQMINYAFTYQCNIYNKFDKQNISNSSQQLNSQQKQKFWQPKDIQIKMQMNQLKFKLNQYKYCWIDYFQNRRQFCFRMTDDCLLSLKFSNANLYMNKVESCLLYDAIKQKQNQSLNSQQFIKEERGTKIKKSILQKKCEDKQKYYEAFLSYRKSRSTAYYNFVYELNILTQTNLKQNTDLSYQVKLLQVDNYNNNKNLSNDINPDSQNNDFISQEDEIEKIKTKQKKICINSSDMTIFNVKNLLIDNHLLKKAKFRKRFNKALELKLLKQFNLASLK